MVVLTLNDFTRLFCERCRKYGVNWQAAGFYGTDGKVYGFGTDTKVISTVFETMSAPLVSEIAAEYGYTVEASAQTIYPDFTLIPPNNEGFKIAVDVKTTYRKGNAKFRYTLGSYTSFLRDPKAKKNIRYPYKEYGEHWVLGFLYSRRPGVSAKVYFDARNVELSCPYENVEFFVQEKFRIAGVTPASGNTANIGSFSTNDINDLRNGKGPFADLGKELCDDYWRYFGKTSSTRPYSTIKDFLTWRSQTRRR